MKRLYSIEGVFGGTDYYDENGEHVGYSVPGVLGGEDYRWDNGETGYSVDSVFSGQNYHGSDGTEVWTVDSITGCGQDIYGDVQGHSVVSPFGGTDFFLDDD